ncbi:hypothetical protein L0222_13405 [bacterium]|nr:hypothetical protein [bacterium]MCI0605976.1 hypothetical protein [bacterium]
MHREVEKNLPIRYLVAALFLFVAFQIEAAETIVDRELTVIRGDFKEVHYLVPETTPNSRVKGFFTCKGGFYDDITFYIFTKDQYVRWFSHYPHKSLFKLEKKKEGKFEIPVVAGETYYFVFDNFFSTVSNKQVKIQVKLVSPQEK